MRPGSDFSCLSFSHHTFRTPRTDTTDAHDTRNTRLVPNTDELWCQIHTAVKLQNHIHSEYLINMMIVVLDRKFYRTLSSLTDMILIYDVKFCQFGKLY